MKRLMWVLQTPPWKCSNSHNAVAEPQQGGGMMSGLGGMVAQGMAFGAGSSIAHHAVGSMFGGSGSGSDSGHSDQGGDQGGGGGGFDDGGGDFDL